MIPEEESITITAYVTTLGYQTIVPQGYITQRRSDGTYIAPLIPSLFYGVGGTQLGHTWRQYLPNIGEQVVLSRVAGMPKVPREQLYWRKIEEKKEPEKVVPTQEAEGIPLIVFVGLGAGALLLGLWIGSSLKH